MTNCAEPRACGHSRGSGRLAKQGQKRVNRRPCRKRSLRVAEGARVSRHASNRTGENPPYGMIRGGGGNVGTIWQPFATMLERADTMEVADLNRARLHSTRPVICRLPKARPQRRHSPCVGSVAMARIMTALARGVIHFLARRSRSGATRGRHL